MIGVSVEVEVGVGVELEVVETAIGSNNAHIVPLILAYQPTCSKPGA